MDYFEEHEKDHGRHSTWYVRVFNATNSSKADEWSGLKRFVHVHKYTICKDRESHNGRLYISSCYDCCAKYYHSGIREHWTIENSLHWVKDVIHNEDRNAIKTKHGPVNSNILSSISINIHRKNGEHSITESQIKFGANLRNLFNIIRT